MGTLRFFLAASVVYNHLGWFLGFSLVPGDTSVQCFYLISGFYMSLVLNGKYEHTSYWMFLSNRFIRLYPVYLIVLVASVWITPKPFPDIGGFDAMFFVVSQLVIFGRDTFLFLHISDGALHFTPTLAVAHPLYVPSLVPQAWTLGVELWFYLLAPLILKRSVRVLVFWFMASLAIRLALKFIFGWSLDPWTYRFFPSELGIFVLGSIAHRLMHRAERFTLLPILAAAMAIALYLNNSTDPHRALALVFFFVVAISLPWLFTATDSEGTIDKEIGEMSYPLYIVHNIFKALFAANPAIAFVLSVMASYFLYKQVDKRLDKWRKSRLARPEPEAKEEVRPLAEARP